MYLEILKANVRKILRKFAVKFCLTFGNNLRKKGFENLEEIFMNFELLRKF